MAVWSDSRRAIRDLAIVGAGSAASATAAVSDLVEMVARSSFTFAAVSAVLAVCTSPLVARSLRGQRDRRRLLTPLVLLRSGVVSGLLWGAGIGGVAGAVASNHLWLGLAWGSMLGATTGALQLGLFLPAWALMRVRRWSTLWFAGLIAALGGATGLAGTALLLWLL